MKVGKVGSEEWKAEILKEIQDNFQECMDAEGDQRELAVRDLTFVNAEGGQWEDSDDSEEDDSPKFQVNRVAGACDQIIGDQRQNRTSIYLFPQSESDKEGAKLMMGIIRNIERESKAEDAYDTAATEQIQCGFGAFRIITDYESDESFDQIIRIKPIFSAATSVFFDPNAEEYDCRDGNFAFVTKWMTKRQFQKMYPNALEDSFDFDQFTQLLPDWFIGDRMRVVEYWYKCPCKRRIALMTDGRVLDLDEDGAIIDELAARTEEEGGPVTIKKERVVDSHEIKMCVASGTEILDGPYEWAGKFIPIVPVWGKTANVDGKKIFRGVARLAIDAQRLYNYGVSALAEQWDLMLKDPYFISDTQAEGHEEEIANFNVNRTPFVRYKPDPVSPGPPSRGGAPQVQQALVMQINAAKEDIYSTTGLEPASMGLAPTLKSGKAIQKEQEMGDRGAFVYQDNLQKSIGTCGEIIIDLVKRIYDGERKIKIANQDGSIEEAVINAQAINAINEVIVDSQTGEPVVVNDLSKGSFAVTVKSGPAFATKKQEQADQLLRLLDIAPELRPMAMDIILDSMDLVGTGEELKERVRESMIKEGRITATDEEAKKLGLDQPQQPDPQQMAIVDNLNSQTELNQVRIQEVIAKVENMDAKTQKIINETVTEATKPLIDMMKVMLDKVNAGLEVSDQEAALMEDQAVLIAEDQAQVIANGEVAGSAPAAAMNQAAQQQQINPVPQPMPPVTPGG